MRDAHFSFRVPFKTTLFRDGGNYSLDKPSSKFIAFPGPIGADVQCSATKLRRWLVDVQNVQRPQTLGVYGTTFCGRK